ncbi:hypothetical protein G5I_02368 [Acromyrmex echinatior]|uniref:Uncharacterized protein n=1 Tax=Acromyrmex echinatior TaxID=103372 RepID=F4WA51_ACREC|nr:hypothetical protein G5I_02368 [Acromyrmex echinatior]
MSRPQRADKASNENVNAKRHLLRKERFERRKETDPLFVIKQAGDPAVGAARKLLLKEDASMRKQISYNERTHHILEALRPNNAEENFVSNRKRCQLQVISHARLQGARRNNDSQGRTREMACD